MGEKHIEAIDAISDVSKNSLADFDRQLAELEAQTARTRSVKKATASSDEQLNDEQKALDKTELTKLVEKLNKELQPDNIAAKLKVETKTGKIYIQIINKRTGEVIEQIPSNEVSSSSENLVDKKG
jgi:flagellar protein FlaG